jgi:hypothetical protein
MPERKADMDMARAQKAVIIIISLIQKKRLNLRQELSNLRLDVSVVDLIMDLRRLITSKAYDTYIKLWCAFVKERCIRQPVISDAANFLASCINLELVAIL